MPNRVLEEHQHSELESWTPTKEATAGHQQIVKEGQSGWVLQAVISRASFRRIPRNGKSYFTMMSLHIHNHYAKKRGIGENLLLAVRTVMRQEQVDMVGGDFNGAAWRRKSGNEQRRNSTMRSSSHLVPKPSGMYIRMQGAVEIPHETLGRSHRPKLPPRSMGASPARQRTTG